MRAMNVTERLVLIARGISRLGVRWFPESYLNEVRDTPHPIHWSLIAGFCVLLSLLVVCLADMRIILFGERAILPLWAILMIFPFAAWFTILTGIVIRRIHR